jgi:hypothetical protein
MLLLLALLAGMLLALLAGMLLALLVYEALSY